MRSSIRSLGLVVVVAVLAACGGGAPAADDSATSSVGESAGVHGAGTEMGSTLVDPSGFTLYVFMADAGSESACYDVCAELWPPVPGNAAIDPDLDASAFGTTTRTDGSDQLTVNGMPLYRYASDTSPGDAGGHGLDGAWFAVDADGRVLEVADTPDTTTGPAYDY